MADPTLNAVVTLKNELTPRLMILRVVTDGWPLPDFKAGQFVPLGLPGAAPRCQLSEPEREPADPNKLIRRAYSVASSSLEASQRSPAKAVVCSPYSDTAPPPASVGLII